MLLNALQMFVRATYIVPPPPPAPMIPCPFCKGSGLQDIHDRVHSVDDLPVMFCEIDGRIHGNCWCCDGTCEVEPEVMEVPRAG